MAMELNKALKRKQRLKVKSAGQNVKVSHRWTVSITVCAFALSVLFSIITSGAEQLGIVLALVTLLIIILLGVVFDIAGVAVSTASEEPFHAMAAKKIPGARQSIRIIRSAQQISSLCNDVIGDIAGIISGAMTSAIVISLAAILPEGEVLINLLLAGLVAALMIGGKAAGKGFAMTHNNEIVFMIGRMVYFFQYVFTFRGKKKNRK